MVTLQADTPLPRRDADLELISQSHRLVNGSDFVEPIRPFAKDLESEIDLGKSADVDGFNQGVRQDDTRSQSLRKVHAAG